MSLSLLAAAREEPERVAVVVSERGGREVTFGELAVPISSAAEAFEAEAGTAGCKPAVAVVGESRLEILVALYALVEAGIPFVLLHPRWSPRERRRALGSSSVERVVDRDWTPPSAPGGFRQRDVEEARTLAVLYTSGTSGRPKGVRLSRRAFVAAAHGSERNLGWLADDRWLLCMPLAHVGGLSILTRCLLARRTLVLAAAGPFDGAAIAATVERHRCTLLSLVPTMLWRLLEHDPQWRLPEHVRAILLGGAAAPPALLERAADRGWPVLTTYGLTEACSQVATQRYATTHRGEAGVGEPMPGLEVRIRGSGSTLSMVPGVVELRGASLFDGYFPAAAFPDPFSADGWFCTGDVGRFDADGRLHLCGRQDDLIISGGENVYPAEVEAALERHPAVARACVFAVEDEQWGELVAAALVARSPRRPTAGELVDFLDRRLAAYKRPRLVAWLDALDESASGKLERARTRDRATPRLLPLRPEAGSAPSSIRDTSPPCEDKCS